MGNFALAILGTLCQSSGATLDKFILSLPKITFRNYISISFPVYFLINLIIFFLFGAPLNPGNFSLYTVALIIGITAIAAMTNIKFYKALDADKLSEVQTFEVFRNIPIILFSSLFFSDEKNIFVLLAAFAATAAIAWSHWEHHHLKFNKRGLSYLLWIIVSAPLEAMGAKLLLQTMNPITIAVIRSGVLLLVLMPLFHSSAKKNMKANGMIIMTTILAAIGWLLQYISYQKVGIVQTTLIFSLQPMLVYLASFLIIKEKFHWKKAVAFLIILITIVPTLHW